MSATAHRYPQSLSAPARNASVSEVVRCAAALLLLLAVAGCARPTGDFGRAQPGLLHDDVMPAIGSTRAQLAKEPVSRLNLADEEREMRDRIWRFLVAPHAHDWFSDTAVELQRTRISGPLDHKFEPRRYYRWLRQTSYSSSSTRYRTVADHVTADLGTMPETFRAICQVLELDRQRQTASLGLGGLQREEVAARSYENRSHIAWFVRAARFRYDAYSLALDNLLVETPHREAVEVDARLAKLAVEVERAERADFCSGAAEVRFRARGEAIPSRVISGTPRGGGYRK
jgi:hypothetical protein